MTSDREGRFLLTGLSPGRYLIRVVAERCVAIAEVRLLAGASVMVEVPVEGIGGGNGLRPPLSEMPEDVTSSEVPIPEQSDNEGEIVGVPGSNSEVTTQRQTDKYAEIEELPGDSSEAPIPEQMVSEIEELPGEDSDGTAPSPVSDLEIEFVYNGRKYIVGADAYPGSLILLQDATLLEVQGWLESLPPQPAGLAKIDYERINDEPRKRTAERLGAKLARQRGLSAHEATA